MYILSGSFLYLFANNTILWLIILFEWNKYYGKLIYLPAGRVDTRLLQWKRIRFSHSQSALTNKLEEHGFDDI